MNLTGREAKVMLMLIDDKLSDLDDQGMQSGNYASDLSNLRDKIVKAMRELASSRPSV